MTGMEYLLEHLEDRKLFYMLSQTRQQERILIRRSNQPGVDQTELGSFRLGLEILKWICIHESQWKDPCQVVGRDNVMIDQASH
jgi:hypothetical protein